MPNYPAKVWNGSEWLGVGTQVADISPYALKDGSNWAAPWMGAWTSYTPILAQGASTNIAKTVTYARYTQIGKTIICNMRLDATGSGSAGSPITASLPFTASANSLTIGSGIYNDGGVIYKSIMYLESASTISHQRADSTSAGAIGQVPSFAVASGDSFWASVIYEAA